MSKEQLLRQLHEQKQEIKVLKQLYIDQETLYEVQEKENREKIVEEKRSLRAKLQEKFQQQEKFLEDCFRRKVRLFCFSLLIKSLIQFLLDGEPRNSISAIAA
jgi:fructose-1,6-bisphosphatase